MQVSTIRPNFPLKICHLLVPLSSPNLRPFQSSTGIILKRLVDSVLRYQCQELDVLKARKEKLRNLYFFHPSYQS